MTKEELLLIALKNMATYRNYLLLHTAILENKITEDEFNKELEYNEKKYVISQNIIPCLDDVRMALDIYKDLTGPEYLKDFCETFSFDEESVKLVVGLTNNQIRENE